jgi:hypothetical protein
MKSISDFLKGLAEEFPDQIAGKSQFGGFDGPPLPEDQQYRATISRGEWRQSQGSGKYSYAVTFEIQEPSEHAGRKFTEYYSADESAHRVSREKFSKLIGESGLNLAEVDQSSEETFAAAFEGTSYVIATRTWGEENDRTGLRYLNRDRGQELKKIAPAKGQEAAKPLRADISVNKNVGPFSAEQPETDEQGEEEEVVAAEPTQAPITLPGGTRPSGVSLPPGLRRN